MDSFLYWYSQNNKLIIQVLAVLIGIVLITLVYRLFFSAADANEESEGNTKSSAQIQDIDKKISGVISALENFKPTAPPAQEASIEAPVVPVITPEVAAAGSQAIEPPITSVETTTIEGAVAAAATTVTETVVVNTAESDALKKDLEAAKLTIKAKEKELSEIKDQLAEQRKLAEKNSKTPSRVMIDTSTLSGDQDLIAKIDELQKKLAEYDIISEDIAELQTLRKENSELKEKIGGGSTEPAPAPPEET